ncbi:hypothetical protein [Cupriavidus taiwanensis]|uniref:hypothetical protein n=1 Tax=Cupriavidus taiwanensis TaxID=164546 RepID=UPI0015F280B3|nr:hypothetical protein [Cupriavidus taiwanensis]
MHASLSRAFGDGVASRPTPVSSSIEHGVARAYRVECVKHAGRAPVTRVARVSKRAAAQLDARRSRVGASPAKPLSMRLFGKCEDTRQSFSLSSRACCAACHRYARRCVKAAARAVSEAASRSVRERA